LRDRYSLRSLPNHVESVIKGSRLTHEDALVTRETYPRGYWPGDSDFAHLEFALKREGIHLQFLRELLPKLSADELTAFVRSKPTGANTRRIWLLYEEFTGSFVLPVPLLKGSPSLDGG
jgi:hypothetical protein